RLGVSLIEQEQPEEATEYFTKLLRDYPNSEFSGKGKDYLEKLGKPIPTPSNDNPAPERPSFMGKFGLILGRNGLEISQDGVLLSKKGTEKEDVKDEVKPSDASNAAGTRAIRASTRGAVVTNQAEATPAPAARQSANGPANGASAGQPAAPETKSAEPKKDDKKDPKKKKKGFLGGIFR
ncbi:MAG: tetratricopeptide repeat protein, partial [Blastocatellia bacterium]